MIAIVALVVTLSLGPLLGSAIAQAVIPHGRGASESGVKQQGEPQAGTVSIGIYDPTGQSPDTMTWLSYPAAPPSGFHWQHSGSPAIRLDPTTGQPLAGQSTGTWVLVRDGYTMPKMR
jgi:hypothetical protein